MVLVYGIVGTHIQQFEHRFVFIIIPNSDITFVILKKQQKKKLGVVEGNQLMKELANKEPSKRFKVCD
jgi:hypothetical protein